MMITHFTIHISPFQMGARIISYIFCAPCIDFLKNSSAFRKMLLTSVTLVVTILLVASPILFLISAAPSIPQHHREDCELQNDCIINSNPISECMEKICINSAETISLNINWTIDPCNDFKSFCCIDQSENINKVLKSPQELVDQNMLGNKQYENIINSGVIELNNIKCKILQIYSKKILPTEHFDSWEDYLIVV